MEQSGKPPKANNLNNKLRPRCKQKLQQPSSPPHTNGHGPENVDDDSDHNKDSEIDSDEFQDESEDELDLESLISSIGSDEEEEEESFSEEASEASSDVIPVPRSHEMKTRGGGQGGTNNNIRLNGAIGRRLRNQSTGSDTANMITSPKRTRLSSKQEFDDDEVTFRYEQNNRE